MENKNKVSTQTNRKTLVERKYEDISKLNKINKRLSRIEKDLILLNEERRELEEQKKELLKGLENVR